MGNFPEITFQLAGQTVNPPREWLEFEILATFERGNPQANITTESITFVNEEAKLLRDWISAGINGTGVGIFEGPEFKMAINSNSGQYDAFIGFVNLSEGMKINSPVSLSAAIQKEAGLVSFSQRTEGVTYQSLYDQGVYSNNDFSSIPYVLQEEFDFWQFTMLSVTTFLMVKELAAVTRDLAKDIANIIAHTAGGATGPAAGIAFSIASAVLNLAYAVLLIIYIKNLIEQLIEQIFQPVRYKKGIQWRKLFTKACNHLGYGFSSSISDLDEVFYIPTSTEPGSTSSGTAGNGLPRSQDFGYTVFEQFKLAQDAFEAKFTIKDVNGQQTVFLEPLNNSAFWVQQSAYQLPDVLDEVTEYNTEELKANILISFTPDLNNAWTLKNWRGTSYEITTDQIVTVNQKRKMVKGLTEIRFPVALPVRKDGLNDAETALRNLAQVVDNVINFFGGSSSYAAQITARIGMLKVSSHEWQIPVLAKLSGGKLPANHRTTWSAKYLWDNYINYRSFVSNNFGGQYRIFKERKIPMGFSDFLALIENSYCTTLNGSSAQVMSIKWNISKDYATADYRVQEVYTKNLKETFREEQ